MNSSLIQQLPQDRQFQSITHAGGANTSMLSQNLLQETIFNQSFNGAAANVSSRYQTGNHPSSQSNYNKRKQQVASINELLNVAETLKQSNYSMRPRQSVQHQPGAKENSATDVRQKPMSNNFLTQQQQQSSYNKSAQ